MFLKSFIRFMLFVVALIAPGGFGVVPELAAVSAVSCVCAVSVVQAAGAQPADVTVAAPEAAGAAQLTVQLGSWENDFFSHQYPDDTPDHRLGRLEQLIYGAVQKGTVEDRVHKLSAALNQAESGSLNGSFRSNSAAGSPVAGSVSEPSQDQNPPLVGDPVRVPEMTVTAKMFATLMKPDAIIENLNAAIRDNPKDSELQYQRGKAYIQTGKYDRALSDLSDAIVMQPNRSDFYLARAWVYHKLGNGVLSDLDIKQAQFVDPKFAEKIEWGQ